jgi:hypothetical protein
VQRVEQRPNDELVSAAQPHSLQVLQQLGNFGWTLAVLDTLPFGLAVPLHEALQLLRDNPPAGASNCGTFIDAPRICIDYRHLHL